VPVVAPPAEGGTWPDLAEYPSPRRIAPAFASQTPDAIFDLGVEVILDGPEARVASRP